MTMIQTAYYSKLVRVIEPGFAGPVRGRLEGETVVGELVFQPGVAVLPAGIQVGVERIRHVFAVLMCLDNVLEQQLFLREQLLTERAELQRFRRFGLPDIVDQNHDMHLEVRLINATLPPRQGDVKGTRALFTENYET